MIKEGNKIIKEEISVNPAKRNFILQNLYLEDKQQQLALFLVLSKPQNTVMLSKRITDSKTRK